MKTKLTARIEKKGNRYYFYLNGESEYSSSHVKIDSFYEELYNLINLGYEITIF